MKRIKRAVIAVCSTTALVLGILIAVPIAAHAAPTNCTTFVGTDGRGYGHCTGGTGYYKVGIACRPVGPFGQYGFGFTAEGEWARVGGLYKSVAKCPLGAATGFPTATAPTTPGSIGLPRESESWQWGLPW